MLDRSRLVAEYGELAFAILNAAFGAEDGRSDADKLDDAIAAMTTVVAGLLASAPDACADVFCGNVRTQISSMREKVKAQTAG